MQSLDLNTPFFIVGPLRSGTTLLRLLAGHHPEICRCEEMDFVTPTLATSQQLPDSTEYSSAMQTDRGFRLSGYQIDATQTFDQIAMSFLAQRQTMDGKPYVGATVHHDFDQLPRIWPQAKYIYLLRDPRDVARSCVQMGWAGTAWHGAAHWTQANDAWGQLSQTIASEQRIIVRFEDLISDSKAILERVCEFIGVEYCPAMLDIEQDTTYSRPDPKAAASWMSAPQRDIQQVEARVGKQRMEQWGYTPSNIPELELTFVTRLQISISDLVGRIRLRMKRFGIGLWALGVVSRRLPFKRLRESTQLKIDAVTDSRMK